MSEINKASRYGPGGRFCICCGPSPKNRRVYDRVVKHRIRFEVKKEIRKELKEMLFNPCNPD